VTVSGPIKYQPKGDPTGWPAAAKGILATEKPAAIMLGLNDRMAIREPVANAWPLLREQRTGTHLAGKRCIMPTS
jgi:hypothetical protein